MRALLLSKKRREVVDGFSERLAEALGPHTLADLAYVLGVPFKSLISRMHRDLPHPVRLREIASALGVSVQWLLSGQGQSRGLMSSQGEGLRLPEHHRGEKWLGERVLVALGRDSSELPASLALRRRWLKRMVGLSDAGFHALLYGGAFPSAEVLLKIADLLNADVDYLLCGFNGHVTAKERWSSERLSWRCRMEMAVHRRAMRLSSRRNGHNGHDERLIGIARRHCSRESAPRSRDLLDLARYLNLSVEWLLRGEMTRREGMLPFVPWDRLAWWMPDYPYVLYAQHDQKYVEAAQTEPDAFATVLKSPPADLRVAFPVVIQVSPHAHLVSGQWMVGVNLRTLASSFLRYEPRYYNDYCRMMRGTMRIIGPAIPLWNVNARDFV